jgi:hypoxanthine-guanine phosphoribosyltransferase
MELKQSSINFDEYPVPLTVSAININDNFEFSVDHFSFEESKKQYIESVLIPEGLMKSRFEKMAEDILKDLKANAINELHILVIMNGAYPFFKCLHDKLTEICRQDGCMITFKLHFQKLSSYIGTQSTGSIEGIEYL